jgi:carboxyl-terminal processing protease
VAYAGGLGPVLGQGVVGEFLDRSGDVFSKWLYKNGRAWSGFNEDMPIGGASVAGQPVVIADQHFPVAILIDQATGSAGEAVATAFKGRPLTRFFGANTAGATSGAESFALSDGAVVVLPGVAMADRNGRSYKGGIAPDQQIVYKRLQFGKDSVVEAALRWLFMETGHGTAKE